MLESVIVGCAVGGAALWLIRMSARKHSKNRNHEHCGGCGSCSSNRADEVVVLPKRGKQ